MKNTDAFQEFARECRYHARRQLCRQQRERKLRDIRAQIRGGTYETNEKLDAAVDRMLDREGFTSRPPVTGFTDEAIDDLCEAEASRVIDYGGSHRFADSAVYLDGLDLAGE